MLENQKEGQYGRNRAALGVAEVREAERGPLLEVSGNVMSPVIEGSLFVVNKGVMQRGVKARPDIIKLSSRHTYLNPLAHPCLGNCSDSG